MLCLCSNTLFSFAHTAWVPRLLLLSLEGAHQAALLCVEGRPPALTPEPTGRWRRLAAEHR